MKVNKKIIKAGITQGILEIVPACEMCGNSYDKCTCNTKHK